MKERLTDYERHILWLIENRLCMSMLDDRHPTISAFVERGLVEKKEYGLAVTEIGHAALNATQGLER
jgi:hypothetical protein